MLNADTGRKFANPPDHYMKILSIGYPKTLEDGLKIKRFADRYTKECKPLVDKENEENPVPALEINYADRKMAPFGL